MNTTQLINKGFNHGYILALENPTFLKELLESIHDPNNLYRIALIRGMEQAQEKSRSREKDQKKGKNKGMGM